MEICLFLDWGWGEEETLYTVPRRSIVKLTKRGLSPLFVSNPTITISKAALSGCDGHKSSPLTPQFCACRITVPCFAMGCPCSGGGKLHILHKINSLLLNSGRGGGLARTFANWPALLAARVESVFSCGSLFVCGSGVCMTGRGWGGGLFAGVPLATPDRGQHVTAFHWLSVLPYANETGASL